jgi:thiol-disulfide isomerase/thioredoxin
MTIATLLVALIATTAAEGQGDPVLLDFHAPWCGPCRQMRPEVEKLVQKGYPVKSIDIDRSPETRDEYNVAAVPTFIVVDAAGKVLARTSGAMPAAQLASFYNETKTRSPSHAPASAPAPVETAEDGGDSRANIEDVPAEGDPAETPAAPPLVNPRPWETVVRIKMHLSDSEWGFGSGTIIHSTAEESIILTCAHIFRIKGRPQPTAQNFRVPISVDLFDGQPVTRQPFMINCSEKDLPGEAIDYDFTHDVGLIRIRPGRRLMASRVVPPDWKPRKGMKMYTVGCSHGHDATAWDTMILDPRVSMSNSSTKQGFATIKCAHQPKEGRSGGGLYTTDGYVAGVCDFADPNEQVGLYAVPEAIHRLLDRNQLMALYRRGDPSGALLASNGGRTRPQGSQGTYVRAQNSPLKESAPANDAITLPPFNMVAGRNVPGTGPNKAWQRAGAPANSPRPSRFPGRSDPLLADSVDPGARPGEAISTELSMEPSPEARAFDKPETPAPRRTRPAPPASSPSSGGWRRAPQALPDLVGSSPSQ